MKAKPQILDSSIKENVMERIEHGVMIMKEGKAWGIEYEDGNSTCYGWISPENKRAMIYDPKSCTKTTDVTYPGSPLIEKLLKGKLVPVERKTTITILTK